MLFGFGFSTFNAINFWYQSVNFFPWKEFCEGKILKVFLERKNLLWEEENKFALKENLKEKLQQQHMFKEV